MHPSKHAPEYEFFLDTVALQSVWQLHGRLPFRTWISRPAICINRPCGGGKNLKQKDSVRKLGNVRYWIAAENQGDHIDLDGPKQHKGSVNRHSHPNRTHSFG